MSLRVRADGTVLCAAMHPELPGDRYFGDAAHYQLSVVLGVLVTEPMHPEHQPGVNRGGHAEHGEWWWRSAVPADVAPEFRSWTRLQLTLDALRA